MKAKPDTKSVLKFLFKNVKSKDVQKELLDFSLFLSVATNKNRKEILRLLKKEGELTITEIADKVGLAYKNVHAHIKKLLSVGLITTEKQEKTIGRKVLVKLAVLPDITKKEATDRIKKWIDDLP